MHGKNVSFNQNVSKLAQTVKSTLHYKGLRLLTKGAIKTLRRLLFFLLCKGINNETLKKLL